MKKLFLTLLAAGSMAAVNAQSAGSILVYGNLGFYSGQDSSKGKSVGFNINPGVGYQLDKMWTVGLQGGYSANGYTPNGDKKYNQSSMSIGAFVRHTHHISDIFSVFAQLDLGYMSGNETYDGKDIPGAKWTGFGAMITPAVSVNVGKCWALNFSFGGLGYMSQNYSGTPSVTTSSFNFTFGQTANIGISKYFSCGGHHMQHAHQEPGADTRKMNTKDDDDDDAPKSKKAKAKKDDDD